LIKVNDPVQIKYGSCKNFNILNLTSVYRKIRAVFFKQNEIDGIKLLKSDTYLVSYPKSGNTWIRFLLINYFLNPNRNKINYTDLEDFIPSIHKSTAEQINNLKGFRIIKSHFVKNEYPKIIYIVRDGRDALVSYYYFLRDLKHFEGSFEEFYNSRSFGDIGDWDVHVRAAIDYQETHPEKIIIVAYEDLKNDTSAIFKRVIKFLGHSIDLDVLNLAIDISTFKTLKNMQKKGGVSIENKEVDFFRKGLSGQWEEYFTDEMNTDFIQKSKDLLEMFGYKVNT